MAKRLLTKTLAVILLLSLALTFAACSDDTTTTTAPSASSSTPSSTPNQPTDAIPSQIENVKGELTPDTPVQFYYMEGGNGLYTGTSIWVDETLGVISDVESAIVDRNNKIMNDLGIVIPEPVLVQGGITDMQANTKDLFDAQSPELDVYCGYQYYDISLAATGNLINLNTLRNARGEKIIDIEQPYWATNYIKSITYNDNIYWVTGALTLRYLGGLYCTFVNQNIYNSLVASHYDGRSIYKIVDDGDWTMETMLEMASHAWADDDANGEASELDTTVGIVFETQDSLDALAFGCQIDFSRKTTDPATGKETIQLTFNTSTRATELSNYIAQLYDAKCNLNIGNEDSKLMMQHFSDGKALFAVNKIFQAEVWLGQMDNFAIIPTPKLNKDQTNYASGVHDGLTIYGISKYSDCQKEAAATLELMAYYSNKDVAPVYYDKVLQGSRTVRDDDAPRMIDMIRAGFDSDFVCAWSASINDIVHTYRTEANIGNKFAWFKRTYQGKWQTSLTQLLEKLEANALPE